MATFNELHRDRWIIAELLTGGRIRDRIVRWGLRLELKKIDREIQALVDSHMVIR
jgi:hypothetical protein